MQYQIKGNYFNGQYHYPEKSDLTFLERTCPAELDLTLWKAPLDYDSIDPIINSAVKGFDSWKKKNLQERIELLKSYQSKLAEKEEAIAEAIAWETGKPLWESKTEASSVIKKVDVTIEHSLPRIQSKCFESIMPDTRGHLLFKPLGPCLIIGPFNFPCHLPNTQILSAIIAGNSVIFKPSEKTCYSAQLLIDCFHEAGFPKGVVNLLQGDGEAAGRIVKNKAIRGIFFTGSLEIGKKILTSVGDDVTKMVALELGGKNAAILHSDADKEQALEELLKGSFLTSGQRCTSTSLIIIHQDIAEDFIEDFHSRAKKIIVDHPLNHKEKPFMGPLIDKKSMENYLLFMGMAKRENIQEIMRGKQLEKNNPGYYVSPSIHFAPTFNPKSRFLNSEIFGPNATFIPYKTIDEAIQIANSTEYGLAAAIFTQSQELYQQCLIDLDAGLINLNRSTCGASPLLPFGGIKNSGNYRPAAVAAIDSCVYQACGLEVTLNPLPEQNT